MGTVQDVIGVVLVNDFVNFSARRNGCSLSEPLRELHLTLVQDLINVVLVNVFVNFTELKCKTWIRVVLVKD